MGGYHVKSGEKWVFLNCICAFQQIDLLCESGNERDGKKRERERERAIVGVFYRMLANMMFYVSIKSSKAMLTFHGLETLSVVCENGCIV